MAWATIDKTAWPRGVTPNVVDYDAAVKAFSWHAARRDLDGRPGGRGLNIAHEADAGRSRGACRLAMGNDAPHCAARQVDIVDLEAGGAQRSADPAPRSRAHHDRQAVVVGDEAVAGGQRHWRAVAHDAHTAHCMMAQEFDALGWRDLVHGRLTSRCEAAHSLSRHGRNRERQRTFERRDLGA